MSAILQLQSCRIEIGQTIPLCVIINHLGWFSLKLGAKLSVYGDFRLGKSSDDSFVKADEGV